MAEKDYYAESKRLKAEAMANAEKLTNRPLYFKLNKGFEMQVEVTKTDVKTMVSKNTTDNKFNAIKNALLRDVHGFLVKAKYVGWRRVVEGKHEETAYFVYYNRTLGANTYIALRKMKDKYVYKPYVVIDEHTFSYISKYIIKGNPPL